MSRVAARAANISDTVASRKTAGRAGGRRMDRNRMMRLEKLERKS